MLSRVRRLLERSLRYAARRSGMALVPADLPWAPADYPVRFVARQDSGVVLDIGANEGQFAIGLRKAGYKGRVLSFEPQPNAFEVLKQRASADLSWRCYPFALGEQEGAALMSISGFSESSSLLPIGKAHVELMPNTAVVGTQQIEVRRLDRIAEDLGLAKEKFFLKLDVQGFEARVLRGAGDWLSRAEGAVVELNFAPLFDGQSAYLEVMGTLEAAGLNFVALANYNLHPATGEFLWADAFFLRRSK